MKPILLALTLLASLCHSQPNHPYLDPPPPTKHFHESPLHPHYDSRFLTTPLKYDAKQSALRALIQTYLLTMHEIGAETWLMHGTLLGWYWNRKIMPWDSDLDVMVSEGSLGELAAWWNMTERAFKVGGEEGVGRRYLLEVNPHWREGEVDGENRIDARWIDTDSGLFIDITTLRRNVTGLDDEVMVVKDGHRYLWDDIFPLRKSVFEGVEVKVPFAYAEVLVEEYGGEALAGVRYESHGFDGERGEWVPLRVTMSGPWEEAG